LTKKYDVIGHHVRSWNPHPGRPTWMPLSLTLLRTKR
jgi:hypothetical protein